LNLAGAVALLPKRPVVAAFTATATPEVRDDIVSKLELKDPFLLTTGFDRENLFFQVEHPQDKTMFLLNYIKKFPGVPGIVYCSTRRAVEEVYDFLRRKGIGAVRYHAKLDSEERQKNQEAFIDNRSPLMVATNAFGMGIDKSNVRYVVHYNMPGSIDNYYQEAGRAGRDGAPADCILLFAPEDIIIARFLIDRNKKTDNKQVKYQKLQLMIDYCNTRHCLRATILEYFGETAKNGCNACGNCVTVEKLKKTVELKKTVDFLAADGCLEVSDGEYPALGFTQKARPCLRGQEKLLMRKRVAHPRTLNEPGLSREQKIGVSRKMKSLVTPAKRELFERLRALRRELADAQNVSSYIVFSDAVLCGMCAELPKNEAEFLAIPGVGQVKLKKYGAHFLRILREWQ
jgi:ATP-dependent DNA helicase RecQ